MKKTAYASILVLSLSVLFVPLFFVNVHATSGCLTTCQLKADTTVPPADGTVYVELDNNAASVYSLPHTFSFANNSQHTLTVLNSTLTTTSGSGARYVWNEWTHSSLQWTPTVTMQTPFMLFNYTGSSDGGPFIAKFDKQFQYTLTFKDAAGQGLTPAPTSVALSSSGSTITTTAYSNQWLLATSWTVTSASWEGYPQALPAPVHVDLSSGSATAAVAIGAYQASVKVVDNLNNPIQGASVTITFANATSRAFTTDSRGTISLGDIPAGPYLAHVVYQGQEQRTSEDASVASASTITLNIGGASSAPVVSAIVLLTIFGVALFLILLAIKVRKPPPPPKI